MATTSWQTGEDHSSVFQRRSLSLLAARRSRERGPRRAQRKSAAPRPTTPSTTRPRQSWSWIPALPVPARARPSCRFSTGGERACRCPSLARVGLKVSPRIGHLHITVDDLPWHWADASDSNTVDVVGLPPRRTQGAYRVGRPSDQVFTGCLTCRQTVTFTIPQAESIGTEASARDFLPQAETGWSNPRLSLLFSFQSSAKRPYQSL